MRYLHQPLFRVLFDGKKTKQTGRMQTLFQRRLQGEQESIEPVHQRNRTRSGRIKNEIENCSSQTCVYFEKYRSNYCF